MIDRLIIPFGHAQAVLRARPGTRPTHYESAKELNQIVERFFADMPSPADRCESA